MFAAESQLEKAVKILKKQSAWWPLPEQASRSKAAFRPFEGLRVYGKNTTR